MIEAVGSLAQHALGDHRTPTGAELALCPSLGAFTLSKRPALIESTRYSLPDALTQLLAIEATTLRPLRALAIGGLPSLPGVLSESLLKELAQLLTALIAIGSLGILTLFVALLFPLALCLLVRMHGAGGRREQGEGGRGDQDQGVGSHGCIPLGWMVWARDHPSGGLAV